MTNHVYKIVEIVGTSQDGTDAAIRAALARAAETIRHVRWFEVIGQRGFVGDDGTLVHQVTLKVGFGLD